MIGLASVHLVTVINFVFQGSYIVSVPYSLLPVFTSYDLYILVSCLCMSFAAFMRNKLHLNEKSNKIK